MEGCFAAYRHRVTGHAWLHRLADVAAGPADFIRDFGAAVAPFAPVPRGRRVVVDTRAVVGNGSAEFEAAVRTCHRQYLAQFTSAMIVVQSVVGAMQAKRVGAEARGLVVRVVDDPATAEAFNAERE